METEARNVEEIISDLASVSATVSELIEASSGITSDMKGLAKRADALASLAKGYEGLPERLTAMVREAAATTSDAADREPEVRVGIAINPRYGFIVGEDEEVGPTLRVDVNTDGRWLLVRTAGRNLGRFLRTSKVADINALKDRHVRIIEDGETGWRLVALLSTEEQDELIAEGIAGLESLGRDVEGRHIKEGMRVSVSGFDLSSGQMVTGTVVSDGFRKRLAVKRDDGVSGGGKDGAWIIHDDMPGIIRIIDGGEPQAPGGETPLTKGMVAGLKKGDRLRIDGEVATFERDCDRAGACFYAEGPEGSRPVETAGKDITLLAPIVTTGRPVYAGDHVKIGEMAGVAYPGTDSFPMQLLRDDGTDGGGDEIAVDGVERKLWLVSTESARSAVHV